MNFKDVRKLMIEKELTYEDLLGKIPTTKGDFYNTKSGLIKAFKYSKKKSENCDRAVKVLLQLNYKRKETAEERNILNNKLKKEKTKNKIENFINLQNKSEEYKKLLLEFVKYKKQTNKNLKTTKPIEVLLQYFDDEVALKEALKEVLEYMEERKEEESQ